MPLDNKRLFCADGSLRRIRGYWPPLLLPCDGAVVAEFLAAARKAAVAAPDGVELFAERSHQGRVVSEEAVLEVASVFALCAQSGARQVGAAEVGLHAVHDDALEVDARAEHALEPAAQDRATWSCPTSAPKTTARTTASTTTNSAPVTKPPSAVSASTAASAPPAATSSSTVATTPPARTERYITITF